MKIEIWSEPGNLYLKAPGRSGLFYIELPNGKELTFLADIQKTGRKKKSTIYKFMDILKTKSRDEKN